MTKESLVDIVKGQAKVAGLMVDGEHISEAIDRAAVKVWYAYQWECRRVTTTLASGTDEYVDLPDDFRSLKSLVYRSGSTEGWQIDFEGEDRYDIDFPNPDVFTADAPRKMKIVQVDGVWRAYFTPQPDASYDLTLVYNRKYGDVTLLDDALEDLVIVAAWGFIHPAGTTQWMSARAAFKTALQEAIDNDTPAQVSVGAVKRPRRFDVGDAGEVKDDWYLVCDGSDY